MIIDERILDDLTERAKESPRLRMNLDLRNSPDDLSQRMLNALEPGTVMPIHRHHASSETVVILRGKIRWIFYDDQGRITESTELRSDGDIRMMNVEKDRWHSLECLESGSVLYESKDGPYPSTGRGRDNGEVNYGKYEEQKDHSFGKKEFGLFASISLSSKVDR